MYNVENVENEHHKILLISRQQRNNQDNIKKKNMCVSADPFQHKI